MKKFLTVNFAIALMLSGSIKANTLDQNQQLTEAEKSCFEGARELVIILDGEVNLSNVGLVNDLTRACEDGLITFN